MEDLESGGAGVVMRQGASWLVGVYLLVTSTATPALLGQPFAFASLTWGGGVALNLLMAVSSLYCMYHQASLFHYQGLRLPTYRAMGAAVLGPRGGAAIEALQFFINLGCIITNTILSGQMMQHTYAILCGGPKEVCSFGSLAKWTAVAGLLSWLVVVAIRSMAHIGWVGAAAGAAFLAYCGAAVGMAAAHGARAPPRPYAPQGPPAVQWLGALNGVGILMFQYGVTVLPEIQAVLAHDPKTGTSTPVMVRAAVAAHAIFVPAFLVVGLVGFWAYGNAVDEFLLFATEHPRWLVALASVLATLQLQLATHIYALPLFSRLEAAIVHACPRQAWLRSGHAGTRIAAARPRLAACLQLAPEPAFSVDGGAAVAAASAVRLASAAAVQRAVRGVALGASGGAGAAAAGAEDAEVAVEASEAANGKPGAADAPPHQGVTHGKAAGPGGDGSRVLVSDEGAGPTPSWALQLLHRSAWAVFWTGFAVALPFFAQIMGFVGAVGFGPITYSLPTLLYLRAFGAGRPRALVAFDWAFAVFWLAASAAAAVGAMYGIVQAAGAHAFFS